MGGRSPPSVRDRLVSQRGRVWFPKGEGFGFPKGKGARCGVPKVILKLVSFAGRVLPRFEVLPIFPAPGCGIAIETRNRGRGEKGI